MHCRVGRWGLQGVFQWLVLLGFVLVLAIPARGQSRVIATTGSSSVTNPPNTSKQIQKAPAKTAAKAKPVASTQRKSRSSMDPTAGDDPSRDDPLVRTAAIEALGKRNGSMVAVASDSGRILTIVNQKVALGPGHQPCSVFKPAVALAALGEGVIENDRNRLRLGQKWYLDLVQSMAISNNVYFEKLGQLLGLEKLREYARWFGFGELAGWGISGEPRGAFPIKPPPASRGGVGKIASFGEGISLTPLQLASFLSAVANGGTLYYLQYPENSNGSFEPKVKRQLDIAPWLTPVRQGLEKAVLTGTGRQARQPDMTILGKTGTCTQNGVRLGWFGAYSQMEGGLTVAVLLQGAGTSGPQAAQVAGRFYRALSDQDYFVKSLRNNRSGPLPAMIAPVP